MAKPRPTRVLAILATPFALLADTVRLDNGDRLTGTVTQIHEGVLTLETEYAGTLSIPQSRVAGIATDGPVEVAAGTETAPAPAPATLEGDALAAVRSLWLPGAPQPGAVVEAPAPEKSPWSFSAALDARYTDGNSRGAVAGLNAEANYVRPELWTLKLFTGAEYNKADGSVSEHKVFAGADTDYFLTEKSSLYAREMLLTDRANDIRLRSTFGAGGGYYLYKNPAGNLLEMLRLRAGLGHRYETHRAAQSGSSSAMTVDLGLRLHKALAENIAWTTEITHAPAINDFNDYLFTHDSRCGVDLVKKWRLTYELGVQHAYNSRPAAGNVYLDTTCYARIRKSW